MPRPSDPSDTVPLLERPLTRTDGQPRVALFAYGRTTAATLTLSVGDVIVIGRGHPADLVVAESSVSRCHARVTVSAEGALVEDLESLNGTTLNGEPLKRGTVSFGDELLIGDVRVGLHRLAPGDKRVSGLVAHAEWMERLYEEVRRSGHFKRPVSVLFVEAEPHIDAVAPAVLSRLRRVDRAGLYSSRIISVLLPELSADEAAERAHALVSSSPSVRVGVATFPNDARNADELVERGTAALRRVPREGGVHQSARAAASEAGDAGDVVVASDTMRAVFDLVTRAAASTIPVLIVGETGAGKEIVARALHQRGPRAARPFTAVNCGAIPGELIEATLFGNEKGAFTGADSKREGLFESSHGGTLFLDEIGELTAAAQAALLRVLETRRLRRVGSTKEIEVDVRIVAATHRDLESMVARGDFRSDLLFRLNALALRVPPLRERQEAIVPLAEHFLRRANAESGGPRRDLSSAVREQLRRYPWPGNVRELKNVIERALVLARADLIDEEDLPEHVRAATGDDESGPVAARRPPLPSAPHAEPVDADDDAAGFRDRVRRFEQELVLEALASSDGVQTEAARLLDLPLRTFVHKLKTLGIRRRGTDYAVDDEG